MQPYLSIADMHACTHACRGWFVMERCQADTEYTPAMQKGATVVAHRQELLRMSHQ